MTNDFIKCASCTSVLAFMATANAGVSTCCTGPGPGCDDAACEATVCGVDPFCCDVAWDSICIGEAGDLCGDLCGGTGACPPSDHDCCTTGAAGCTDTACCDTVCAADPFCCQTGWDGICVGEAVSLCGLDCAACPKSDHDCFTTGGAGCSDVECCEAVCALDLFCCQTAWDGICVNEALANCEAPLCCNLRCAADLNYDGVVNGGDLGILTADWGIGGTCSNLDGNGVVDGSDLGLLIAAWGPCTGANYVTEGEPCGDDTNGGCNTPPSGNSNCCFANGGLGCDDPACQDTVCAVDPFCCETAWDGICAGEAVALCGDTCGFTPNFGTIACGDKIIGNAWAVGGTRDTDWYQITFDEPTLITLTMQSQLPMVFGVVDTGGIPDCSLASAINPFGVTAFCGTAEIVDFCIGAGTWWIFAAPNAFDGFPCGANNVYWLELECNGKCAPLSCGNAGHGCDVEGGPFCDDAACCKAVCAIDPFCCDVAWDSICVGEAATVCAGGSNCCFANGGVGCDDPFCTECVCAIDPFCCDTAWDGICAAEAADPAACAGSCPCGDTCDRVIAKLDRAIAKLDRAIQKVQELVPPPSPGQIDQIILQLDGVIAQLDQAIAQLQQGPPDCPSQEQIDRAIAKLQAARALLMRALEKLMLLQDLTLPPIEFELIKQDLLFQLMQARDLLQQALEQLGRGGPACPPSDHDCCTAGAAGCTDIACCEIVCAADPFCCDNTWDQICVGEAVDLCGISCGSACDAADHGCDVTGGPGCTDVKCCEMVCAIDPFCCNNSWDGICVGEAASLCGGGSNCCFANGGAGCDNAACSASVCAIDPFCCATLWDSICAGEAAELCEACGGCPALPCCQASSCCVDHPGTGCDDPACQAAVCGVDPFCCSTAWDLACATEALGTCGVCGAGSAFVNMSFANTPVELCGKGGTNTVVLNGTLFVSSSGIVTGSLSATLDGAVTVTISGSGSSLNLQVSGTTVILGPAQAIDTALVNGQPVSGDAVFNQLFSDLTLGGSVSSWSPTSQAMLALAALGTTSSWAQNAAAGRALEGGNDSLAPGFWCKACIWTAFQLLTKFACTGVTFACVATLAFSAGGLILPCVIAVSIACTILMNAAAYNNFKNMMLQHWG